MMSYCSCGRSHSGQSSKLNAIKSARMMMSWAFYSLCLFDQNMPSHSGYALTVEINGKPCMKFAHKLLTASKVKLKTWVKTT